MWRRGERGGEAGLQARTQEAFAVQQAKCMGLREVKLKGGEPEFGAGPTWA